MIGNALLNLVNCNPPPSRAKHICQHIFGIVRRDRMAAKRGIGQQAVERAFQFPDIGRNPRGQQIKHLATNRRTAQLSCFGPKNGAAQGKVCGLNVGNKPLRQARKNPPLNPLQGMRPPVSTDHQPLARVHQLVNGVEEFLLG